MIGKQKKRTLIMGIINVTPDSFSDGGRWYSTSAAITRAKELVAQGADILDIGGESTRPGSNRISVQTELERVIPVIENLAELGIPLSIDTMRAEVAQAAVKAGAKIVNDVSGGKADPEMFATVAELEADYVLMHWRGQSKQMDELAIYSDVAAESLAETLVQVQLAQAAGISPQRIILDPGFGFAKNISQNWELLRHLEDWIATGYRVLVGASRKRFIGALLAENNLDEGPQSRDEATAAITGYAAHLGAWAVRTHEVRDNLAQSLVWQKLGG